MYNKVIEHNYCKKIGNDIKCGIMSGMNQTSTSPSARSTSSQSRWRHDDIPREKIMEIYNRELEKLKEQVTVIM